MALQLSGLEVRSVFFPHEDRLCPACGLERRYGYKSSGRHFYRLDGLTFAECQMVSCRNGRCPLRFKPMAPPQLLALAPPSKGYGFDVLAYVGRARFEGRLTRGQIHQRLRREHPAVVISERQIENLFELYGALSDGAILKDSTVIATIKKHRAIVLAIDGAKPLRDNDSVWFVRDLMSGITLAAAAMFSCTAEALEELLKPVRALAERIGVPVVGIVSDKEAVNVKAVRRVFPRVRHQFCQLHYVSNLAKPIAKADGKLRSEIKEAMRGLGKAVKELKSVGADGKGLSADQAAIIDELCVAIKSVLRDNGKPPFEPPGLRLLERLLVLRDLVQKMQQEKGGPKFERSPNSYPSRTALNPKAKRSAATIGTSGASQISSSLKDKQPRAPSGY